VRTKSSKGTDYRGNVVHGGIAVLRAWDERQWWRKNNSAESSEFTSLKTSVYIKNSPFLILDTASLQMKLTIVTAHFALKSDVQAPKSQRWAGFRKPRETWMCVRTTFLEVGKNSSLTIP